MPFILKKYPSVKGKKIQLFLLNEANLSMSVSQKLLSRGRVFDENNNRYQNGQTIKGDFVQVAVFEGQTRGLKPIFNTKDFAIFDKPSGIMVHPTSKDTAYSLLDEIRYHFGQSANLAHRIDLETSGLVLVTKNKISDIFLKTMFEDKKYKKSYKAYVKGCIKESIKIDTPITKDGGKIGVKMKVCNGSKKAKESLTFINPISYDKKSDITLVEAIPHTGRQHQLRVHLNSIGHTIIGDPIYGVSDKIADSYLCKTLSKEDRLKYIGHHRLMLHANYLEFSYDEKLYKIYSKQEFI